MLDQESQLVLEINALRLPVLAFAGFGTHALGCRLLHLLQSDHQRKEVVLIHMLSGTLEVSEH